MKENIHCYGILYLFICANLFFVSPIHAQDKKDTVTSKVHKIQEVIVKARRAPNKVASAAPVQTLSREDLDKLAVQDMADAVRRFAGANVKDYGGIGGLKTVSVRNMGAAHTAVSYDGVTVSNCQAGQIDLGRFSLDNVEMLSLSIGQSEDMLQSARQYASAAVLNIETEKPHFENGKNSLIRFQAKGGSFGYLSPALRWWQKAGKSLSISMDANYMRADGNYPFTLRNGKYVTTEKRYNSAIYSYQGELNLFKTFKDNSSLGIKNYYFYSDRELPGAVTLYNPVANEKLWDENYFIQALYKKDFSDKFKTQFQAKYNYAWNKYQEKNQKYVGGVYEQKHRQNEYYLSATGLYSMNDRFNFSLAQDGYINTLWSDMPECPFPTRYTIQSAFNARYKDNLFTANASLVNTFITENVKQGEKQNDFNRLVPSISLSIKPFDKETLFIRLMYKSTMRIPTFNDLYYFQLGNRNLKTEKANEYNLGITWSSNIHNILDYISITIDGYYNNVKDKIIAFPTTYAWKMANYGKVHITGADFTLATAASLSDKVQMVLSGAYTYQKAIDLTDKNTKNYKDQLPYTPRNSGNVSLVVNNPYANLGYSIVGVGKRYYMSQNIDDNMIDGYTEHNISISKEFKLPKYKIRLQGEIINLLNKQYDVIKYYPMPGRSWRITGTITL